MQKNTNAINKSYPNFYSKYIHYPNPNSNPNPNPTLISSQHPNPSYDATMKLQTAATLKIKAKSQVLITLKKI